MSKWTPNTPEPEKAMRAPEPWKPEIWASRLTRAEQLERLEIARAILKRAKRPA